MKHATNAITTVREPTSEFAGLLDGLVDVLQTAHQLVMVVASDLVVADQVAVYVKQLHVPSLHRLPARRNGTLLFDSLASLAVIIH